jgi:hypothetical protein
MKKKKTYIPLPEGCEAFRTSGIVGLTAGCLDITLLLIALLLPVSLCLALKEQNAANFLLPLLSIPLLICFDVPISCIVLLFSRLFCKPRVGILDGRIYMTNWKRSIPMSDICSLDLFLGSYSRRATAEPAQLTITLPHDETFVISHPSVRFLRSLQKSCPHVRISVEWKYRVWLNGGI